MLGLCSGLKTNLKFELVIPKARAGDPSWLCRKIGTKVSLFPH